MKEVTVIKELSWLKFLWKAGAGEVSKDQAGCPGTEKPNTLSMENIVNL